MLNSEFSQFAANSALDLYPRHLAPEIDAVNAWVGGAINSGVYRCGNASTQAEYDQVSAGGDESGCP